MQKLDLFFQIAMKVHQFGSLIRDVKLSNDSDGAVTVAMVAKVAVMTVAA